LVLDTPIGLPGARHRIYNPTVGRASALYRLQQVDLAIDQAKARLAAIEAELAEHSALEDARREAAQADQTLRQTSQATRAAEDAVAGQREKAEQTDARLYGGAIHNPKELQELQAEAEALRRHLAQLEDRQLEAMVAGEQAQQAAEAAQARLELVEASHSGRERDLLRERESLAATLAQRTEEREVATVGVAADDMQLYLTLRKSTGGLAVAELQEDNSCGACGVGLTASARQEVRSGPTLIRCRQCGRILYSS
jgi:predicted  nucleic acid-binding Zn-ribbon protein